eukprot:9113153-Alexandrium_andersonii.AAC.1
MSASLVGSEMCIRDSPDPVAAPDPDGQVGAREEAPALGSLPQEGLEAAVAGVADVLLAGLDHVLEPGLH